MRIYPRGAQWHLEFKRQRKKSFSRSKTTGYLSSKIEKRILPACSGNERKGRYVSVCCHGSLILNGLTNQELWQMYKKYLEAKKLLMSHFEFIYHFKPFG